MVRKKPANDHEWRMLAQVELQQGGAIARVKDWVISDF